MGNLYWSVSSLPSDDRMEELQAALERSFPAEGNRAYLSELVGGRVPLRTAVARLGALSLLPELLIRGGIDPSAILLCRDEHGRPYGVSLGDRITSFDFNLSHSDGHGLCALLTGGGRVGVDVEEAIPPRRALPLMRRFCTEGERRFLAPLSEEEQAAGFTRIWTVREALGKQEGRGMPLRYDASRIPDGISLITGRLSDTGAYLSLCFPKISISDGCLQDASPIAMNVQWDGEAFFYG